MAPSSSREEALPQLPAVGSDGGQCTFLLFLLFGKKHQLRFLLRVELIPWEYLERKRGKHDGLKASWWWGRSTQTPGSPDPHPPRPTCCSGSVEVRPAQGQVSRFLNIVMR